ncbi:hypothetical protein SLS58_007699 [Diplodia intermedia]|uniref:DUF6594 domain-containing protein n=1 Tax=Diplodia intermedia TaxID=856260 RepID=A0ABR3TJA3_9PEZI
MPLEESATPAVAPLNPPAATPTILSPLSASPSTSPSGAPSTPPTPHSNPDSSHTPSTSHNDQQQQLPAGYPKLAEQMERISETAIFRRFDYLNALNLLYMQAELQSLEDELRRLQVEDATAGSEARAKYAVNWFSLSRAATMPSEDGDGGSDEQWHLAREMRAKLKEYNEALLLQTQLLPLAPPGAHDQRYLQKFLESRAMDHGALTGGDALLWGTIDAPRAHASDLVALLPRRGADDAFSKWATEKLVARLLRWRRHRGAAARARDDVDGDDADDGDDRWRLKGYEDGSVLRWTFFVASALASALPVVAIAILYCVPSVPARLGLIAVFSVLLSAAMATFTSARRVDVFAVSAAFAAVQVVFVQVGTTTVTTAAAAMDGGAAQ